MDRVELLEKFLKEGGRLAIKNCAIAQLHIVTEDGQSFEVPVNQLAEDLDEFIFPAEFVDEDFDALTGSKSSSTMFVL